MSPKRVSLPAYADAVAVWNAFIELVAMSDYGDLTPSQRPAHLVFWYESEVQNGGHLQYFLNRGDDQGEETITALRNLGAREQAGVLSQALALWQSAQCKMPVAVDTYVEKARAGEFDNMDKAFHACSENLVSILERHLAATEAEFVSRGP